MSRAGYCARAARRFKRNQLQAAAPGASPFFRQRTKETVMIKSIAGVAFLVLCTSAQAGPSCTQQTTRGNWMYTCEGQLPAPGPTPTRMLGTCTASASGYWTCNGYLNLGGTVLPHTLQGQAHNQPDCTGNITYAQAIGGAPAGTLDIQYVVSQGGLGIDGLPTNPGAVVSCSLKRYGGCAFDW
jgi:hypothetical protein